MFWHEIWKKIQYIYFEMVIATAADLELYVCGRVKNRLVFLGNYSKIIYGSPSHTKRHFNRKMTTTHFKSRSVARNGVIPMPVAMLTFTGKRKAS